MNSRKYKDLCHQFRYINDLREMLNSCAQIYAQMPAFLVKDRPGEKYRPISYEQLKLDVDSLGTRLIDLGLKDKKIAIIGENSYKWVVSYFAAVNGTGVAVPLDRELPPVEIANLLKRAKVDAIIYSKKSEATVSEALKHAKGIKFKINMDQTSHDKKAYALDELVQEGGVLLEKGDLRFIDADLDREAMCALLFTSGTTGLAKGVMLSHKNISANVYNMSKYVKVPTNGPGLSVLPMHHTYELTCHVFGGLYQGLCIAICEGLKYIQQNMKESGASIMLGVPLVFETMHKKVWKQAENAGKTAIMQSMVALSKRLKLYNNPTVVRKMFSQIHNSLGGQVRIFIAGGAAINPEVVEDYQAMGFAMIQGYGMTECAPIITLNKDRYSKAASAGIPLQGTEVKIYKPDKDDGIGEVICRGPSVMIGYYEDPETTAEVLKDGWLHTGDYGYFDREGFLYLCGRKKNVIVTKNGKNIFPEEVEYHLLKNEYIEEAIVYGEEDQRSGDMVICAEIFPNREKTASGLADETEAGLQAFFKTVIDEINDEMPLYKRVKRFKLRKEEFEKTTTKKIKRHGQKKEEESKC